MSRKYRQVGYRDSERDEARSDRPTAPRRTLSKEELIQRRSLRRATNREANEVLRCPDCGGNVHEFGAIGPETTCPRCSAALHCCRTCRHFDSAARWQCRADVDGPIEAKSAANRCSKYAPRVVLDATGRRSGPPRGSGGSGGAREQFENLFKR